LSNVFELAHWQVAARGNQYAGALVFDIYAPGDSNNAKSVSSVWDALDSLALTYTTATPPAPSMSFGVTPDPDAVVILVGSKKPKL
jgi:hypothetical protein